MPWSGAESDWASRVIAGTRVNPARKGAGGAANLGGLGPMRWRAGGGTTTGAEPTTGANPTTATNGGGAGGGAIPRPPDRRNNHRGCKNPRG